MKTLMLRHHLTMLTAVVAAASVGDSDGPDPMRPPGFRTRPEPPSPRGRPPALKQKTSDGCGSAGCRTLDRCICECRVCRGTCRPIT